jgi:hypothetical protein
MKGIQPARLVSAVVFSLTTFCLLGGDAGSSEAGSLSIQPVVQKANVWCSAAVGEMVFDYFHVPNVNPAGHYQCGILGVLASGKQWRECAYRCERCPVPPGNAATIIEMIKDYPRKVAEATGKQVIGLRAAYQSWPLSARDVMAAIDKKSPIIAQISPSGLPAGTAGARHVALLVGYQEREGAMEIKVNDPFPFTGWADNPYLRAGGRAAGDGSYWIEYGAFWQWLKWADSFVIEPTGVVRFSGGRNCCTHLRKCGPFLDGPSRPLGSPCSCQAGDPAPSGRVCS